MGIFIILLVQILLWGANFLIPLTAAILAYLVFNRPRRWLRRLGLPDLVIAGLFTSFLFVLFVVAVIWFAEPVTNFVQNLPRLMREVQFKLSGPGGPLSAVSEAAKAVDDAVEGSGDKTAMEVEVVEGSSATLTIMSLAPQLVSQIVFAIFMTFFLIASGDFFIQRLVESMETLSDKRRAVQVVHHIEDRLGRYLGSIAVINAGLGVFIGAAMVAWGMPNAIAIGLMGFVLNFIPFLGAVLGATIAGFVAFVTFGEFWSAVGVFATYMALTSIEGQLLTPMLVSRRMRLNTPILFLVVAFFAYIWSVVGMVVAVPILIMAKTICDEIKGLNRIGHFLGDADDSIARKKRVRSDSD
ncbi:AI-2E family transporter [Pontibaca salina]|uniref:AI-2E family transporter n=1 Tax=Pontibaca salina TaxID=2795731 RepID=A0A934HNS8_9RHOB|nr:AI-2E family transporter [Pontibaca salina]MBI6628982.1 AI-2E family transporter [Pontibaca salina]